MSARAAAPPSTGHGTVLAFDYGEKYLGVAVGDTATRIAHPLDLVIASGEARFMALDRIVREWQPARLVVGVPLSLEGQEHAMTQRARRFARQLAARYRLPVDLADERLSSADAEATLRSMGKGGRAHKQATHALAAATILQQVLDEPAGR